MTEPVNLQSNESEAECASELRRLLKQRPVGLVVAYLTEHEGEVTATFSMAGDLDPITSVGLAQHLVYWCVQGGET